MAYIHECILQRDMERRVAAYIVAQGFTDLDIAPWSRQNTISTIMNTAEARF